MEEDWDELKLTLPYEGRLFWLLKVEELLVVVFVGAGVEVL